MNGTHSSIGERPLGALLRDLTHDVSDLVRQEIALARAETSEKVSQAGTAIAAIAVGAVFGLAALIIVLQAVVIALAEVMEPWLASAIVGLAVAALAWFMIKKGQNDLKATSLMPQRTARNVRQDAQVVADHMQPGSPDATSTVQPMTPVSTTARPDLEKEARR
jgi:hypothetical protein